jgi:hypothetical protein
MEDFESQRVIYIEKVAQFLKAAKDFSGSKVDIDPIIDKIKRELDILSPYIESEVAVPEKKGSNHIWPVYLAVKYLGDIVVSKDKAERNGEVTGKIIDEWRLNKIISETFFALSGDGGQAYADSLLAAILAEDGDFLGGWTIEPEKSLLNFLTKRVVREYLRINTYNNVLWMGKEQLESLVSCLSISGGLRVEGSIEDDRGERERLENRAKIILDAAAEAGYQVRESVELAEQALFGAD